MVPTKLRAIVRLREAVAATAEPELQRGQDEPEDLRERDYSTSKDVEDAVNDAERMNADRSVRQHIIRNAERIGAGSLIPEDWHRQIAGLKPRKSVKPPAAKKPKSGKPKREGKPTREAVRFVARLHEADVRKTGSAYDATVLREGPGNPADRNAYSREALRKAVEAGMFEGLQAYANHPTPSEERERPERDVRQLVGHFREARYVEDGGVGQVRAKFVPITGPGYEWVTSLIESALAAPADRPLIGISIDGYGHAPDEKDIGGRRYNVVREIAHLGSADIVTRAGAGGRFHRRLSESLAGARASVSVGEEWTGRELQERVRNALERLQDGLAQDDDSRVREAFVALHEAAAVTVKEPAPRRGDTAEVAKLKKRVKLAEAKGAELERAKLAGQLLREVDVPLQTREAWFEEMVDQPDELAMRALLTRRQTERRETIAELRESMGFDRIEGNPRRDPAPTPTLARVCSTGSGSTLRSATYDRDGRGAHDHAPERTHEPIRAAPGLPARSRPGASHRGRPGSPRKAGARVPA